MEIVLYFGGYAQPDRVMWRKKERKKTWKKEAKQKIKLDWESVHCINNFGASVRPSSSSLHLSFGDLQIYPLLQTQNKKLIFFSFSVLKYGCIKYRTVR